MFFSESDLSIELLGVFKINRDKYDHKSFENRGYDILSFRLKGRGKFITKNETITVKPGDVLYIPKNTEYHQKSSDETVIAVHFINYSFKKSNKMEIIRPEASHYIEEIFKNMYDCWKEKKQGHRYRCMSLLYDLLYTLNCQETSQIIDSITHDSKMNSVIDYIHSNFRYGTIDISELADMCSVSSTYFRKMFKKIHGVSPSQYIINLKLEFASHLLSSNLYTVAEVSHKSGFNDTKYFSKLFKQSFGITPKKYQGLQRFDNPLIEK